MSSARTPAVKLSRILAWTVALALLAAPLAGRTAMVCRLTLLPFDFGLYMPGDAAPLDVTGSVDLRCMGEAGSFLVTLSAGASGTFSGRTMTSGPFVLAYNFYANPGRTLVWGDGTGGSVPLGATKAGAGRGDFTLPIYGRVFPEQSVAAGTYSDDILVTVIF